MIALSHPNQKYDRQVREYFFSFGIMSAKILIKSIKTSRQILET